MGPANPAAVAVIAGCVSLVTAVLTAAITVLVAERRLRRDFRLEFSAERVVQKLLTDRRWRWRRFDTIRHFVGGFEDDELRKILVRAGAVRVTTTDHTEFWGLLDRNKHDLRIKIVLESNLKKRNLNWLEQ